MGTSSLSDALQTSSAVRTLGARLERMSEENRQNMEWFKPISGVFYMACSEMFGTSRAESQSREIYMDNMCTIVYVYTI